VTQNEQAKGCRHAGGKIVKRFDMIVACEGVAVDVCLEPFAGLNQHVAD